MGVSPGGIDMIPETLERMGSVMMETIDAELRGVSPGGMLMKPSEEPFYVSQFVRANLRLFLTAHMRYMAPECNCSPQARLTYSEKQSELKSEL